MAQGRSRGGTNRFYPDVVALLRRATPQDEPGLHGVSCVGYSLDGEDGPSTIWKLGETDALSEGREPHWVDLWMYFKCLVSMLTKPGKHSAPLARRIAIATLGRVASHARLPVEELADAVLSSFAARCHPVHIGVIPDLDGANMPTIVSQAIAYVAKAVRLRAQSEIARMKGDYKDTTLGGDMGSFSAENAASHGAMPAGQTPDGRSLWSLSQVARMLDRSRTTVREAANGLKLEGRVVGNARAFTKAEIDQIRAKLPSATRTHPPKREAAKKRVRVRRHFPKGARIWLGDLGWAEVPGPRSTRPR